MLPLTLVSSEGNHYKPSPELAQLLAEKFQLAPQDFQLGLLCIKPIGDCIAKAQYKEVRTNIELDGITYQTREFIFTHYETSDSDGVFKLALSRYDFKKVKQVRISKQDLSLSLRRSIEKQNKHYGDSSKRANKVQAVKSSIARFALDI